jgi:hypothetical protein
MHALSRKYTLYTPHLALTAHELVLLGVFESKISVSTLYVGCRKCRKDQNQKHPIKVRQFGEKVLSSVCLHLSGRLNNNRVGRKALKLVWNSVAIKKASSVFFSVCCRRM